MIFANSIYKRVIASCAFPNFLDFKYRSVKISLLNIWSGYQNLLKNYKLFWRCKPYIDWISMKWNISTGSNAQGVEIFWKEHIIFSFNIARNSQAVEKKQHCTCCQKFWKKICEGNAGLNCRLETYHTTKSHRYFSRICYRKYRTNSLKVTEQLFQNNRIPVYVGHLSVNFFVVKCVLHERCSEIFGKTHRKTPVQTRVAKGEREGGFPPTRLK